MAALLLVVFAAAFLLLGAHHVVVLALQLPPGSVSIDCGRDPNSGAYTDPDNGIYYVPDGAYVDTGENRAVAPDLESLWPRVRYQTLRSFPSGERNCYALPTAAGARHLVRAYFAYGNYDGKNGSASSLQFDLYLGPNYWDTVFGPEAAVSFALEAVFVAWAGWAPVCLVNTGRGTPFVSILELRPLGVALYPQVAPGIIASMVVRRNMGAGGDTRFPDDPYDRVWWAMDTDTASPRLVNLSTTRPIQPDASFAVPSPILQTAVAGAGNATAFTAMTWLWLWGHDAKPHSFMVFLHFADFQNTQLRQFGVNISRNASSGPAVRNLNASYSPPYLASSTLYAEPDDDTTDGYYNITLAATAASVLPPMINAFEVYFRIPFGSPTTLPTDINAIMAIKYEYGVKLDWMGDPCYPAPWKGVKCSNTTVNATRITSLDLSHNSLRGAISANFSLFTALKNLDLSYNNLSGQIPSSLLSMSSLQVLDLSGNHLSGNNLCKKNSGSLTIRSDCNKPARKNRVVLIAIVVVSVLVVSAIFIITYFICREKRKATVFTDGHTSNVQLEKAPRSASQGVHLQDTENRRFTYKDLEMFTDNFKQCLGQGGFGLVYYGNLEDGTEVAVKMRSESSSHGLDEFLAEVQSLTKVHHRNIVSLIGYCWEEDHLALVYEYMSQGNLYDHLRGKNAAAETLSWGTRVQIALEAAQGLDYLHKGCSPPIIHRDVKSANILLGQNLQAKIADLGLSKTYLNDVQTHISATAAGTAGYMDPEYYLTGRLTESSDVYSFGIVLLEVVTGEPPMVPGHGHIVQRVNQRIASSGDVSSVADSRLRGAYDVNSMWKVVDTAMACAAETGEGRPTMADVVAQLKDSLALEDARESDRSSTPVSIAASDSAVLMMSDFGPSAR